MRKIAEAQLSVAKTNYLKRVGEEVGIVSQLDVILPSIRNFSAMSAKKVGARNVSRNPSFSPKNFDMLI